ncbi:MAG: class I SAM-dependent methyltransferase [Pirellulaceae bacterium]
MSDQNQCRFCQKPLNHVFVDLGMSPLCESYLAQHQLNHMEPFYPLCAYVCDQCLLVQLQQYVSPTEIFSDYAYFSSYSDAWVEHAKSYVNDICERLPLDGNSLVLELASNDGYLLQFFVAKGIPVLGIEPAANVAQVALQKGVNTRVAFFDNQIARELRDEGQQADLLVANNVLAHVHELNSFVQGIRTLLKPHGVATIEFPHLMRLVAENQFDTIYHEHFSYFSFLAVEKIFARHELKIFDVQELWSHGGSLRIFVTHSANASEITAPNVERLKMVETQAGMESISYYDGFHRQVEATKRRLLSFLIDAKNTGKSVVGYGAPGKGNTLLNYCGIRTDFLDYTVDRSPHKQGKFLPGTHIPIRHPDAIKQTRPDYLFILPWNLKDEIMSQMAYIRDWGGKFVIPIPELAVLD